MAVPFLNNIDLNKYELQNFKIFNIAGDPTGGTLVSGDAGYTWLNTSTNKIRWWDGAAIRDFLDTSSSISGSQISGNISGNAATATSATTAATCTGNSATVTVTQNQFLVGNSSNIGASTAKNSIPISGFGAATADVDLGSKKIVSLADPTAAQDAATKKYVDDTSQGLDIKQSCVAASTAALPSYVATGTAGTAGAYLEASANGTFPTEIQYISSPQVGDRVLVKNETSTLAKWNGIYTITDVGGALAKWKLTRAADFDAGTATSGSFVFIEQGSTLGGTGWVMTTSGTITINSTAITWTQFSGAGSYGANRGIVLDTSTNQFNFAQNSDYTAGRIPFASSTTAIGFDGGLNWDNTNKRLGIGTATPDNTLHAKVASGLGRLLNESGDGSQVDWQFKNSGGSGYVGILSTGQNFYDSRGPNAAGSGHIWQYSGSELLRLDAAGNLGLGVVPSAWNSSYKALDIGSASIFGRSSGNDVYFNQSVYYGSSNWYYKYSSMAVGRYEMSNGSHYWLNAPSGTAGATQSATSGQQYTVTTLGNTTLAQWQALFNGLTVLPAVGQTITATATDTLAGTATFTQIVSFSTLATLNSTGLGIGGSATQKLAVHSTGANTQFNSLDSTGCYALWTNNGTNLAYIGSAYHLITSGASTDFAIRSQGQLIFATNGANTRLTIDSSGNVGIGVSPEAWNALTPVLRIKPSGANGGGALASNNSDNFRIFANTWYDSGYKRIANGYASCYEQDAGNHYWYTADTGNANSLITSFSSAKMTLNASGNLGIGVTPKTWSVGKAIEIGANGCSLWSYGNDNIYLSSNAYFNGGWKYAAANKIPANYQQYQGAHIWNTAAAWNGSGSDALTFTQAMTLDASGNLGIGVAPSSWDSTWKVLQLNSYYSVFGGDTSGSVQTFMSSNAYYNGSTWKGGVTGSNASLYRQYAGKHEWYYTTNVSNGVGFTFTQAMTLDTSGNLGIGVSPSFKLDVLGTTRITYGSASGATFGANEVLRIDGNANVGTAIGIPSSGNVVGGYYFAVGSNSYAGCIEYNGTTNALSFKSNSTTNLTIASTGAATFAGDVTVNGTGYTKRGSSTFYKIPGIYSEQLTGTGSSFVINHALGSRDVSVTVRQYGSPYAVVITDVEMTDTNNVTVKFASSVNGTLYTVTVIG